MGKKNTRKFSFFSYTFSAKKDIYEHNLYKQDKLLFGFLIFVVIYISSIIVSIFVSGWFKYGGFTMDFLYKGVLRDYFLYFTNQSVFLTLVYCLHILIPHKKQKSNFLGCCVLSQMFIVTIIFWLGYKFVVNEDKLSPMDWFINISNHFVFFIFLIMIFVRTTCKVNYFNKKIKAGDIWKFGLIAPLFFAGYVIGGNFIPQFGSTIDGITYPGFSPYSFLTAFNPEIPDGEWWHISFLPIFLGTYLLLFYVLRKNSNNRYNKETLFLPKKYLLIKIYAYTLITIIISFFTGVINLFFFESNNNDIYLFAVLVLLNIIYLYYAIVLFKTIRREIRGGKLLFLSGFALIFTSFSLLSTALVAWLVFFGQSVPHAMLISIPLLAVFNFIVAFISTINFFIFKKKYLANF